MNVFESGSGKWVMIGSEGDVLYTSDRSRATVFTYQLLRDADRYFADFSIYKNTLHVVHAHSNSAFHDCDLVQEWLGAQDNARHCRAPN